MTVNLRMKWNKKEALNEKIKVNGGKIFPKFLRRFFLSSVLAGLLDSEEEISTSMYELIKEEVMNDVH